MNAAMKENPPPPRDDALMKQFALVGLGPFAKGDIDSLDPAIKRGLQRAIVHGNALLGRVAKAGGSVTGATKTRNNWFYGASNWGRMAADGDFLGRSGTQAFSGVTEHLIEESVKLRTFVDSDGQPLNGDNRYVIRFSKEEIPAAKSFWSVTLYDDAFNLVYNDAGRYSFGDKVPGLIYGADGSLEIYIQPDKPAGDKAANWLPSAKGRTSTSSCGLISRGRTCWTRAMSRCRYSKTEEFEENLHARFLHPKTAPAGRRCRPRPVGAGSHGQGAEHRHDHDRRCRADGHLGHPSRHRRCQYAEHRPHRQEGLMISDFYAQPSCTVGRAAFITGQYPIRTGFTSWAARVACRPKCGRCHSGRVAQGQGLCHRQFGKSHVGDRNEHLPTVHGFDEFFGLLYHLNMMEMFEQPEFPKDPNFVGRPRNVLYTRASDKDDETIDKRFGKVGKQTIEDKGTLGAKCQETFDDEVLAVSTDWLRRTKKSGEPFFLGLRRWRCTSRSTFRPHTKARAGIVSMLTD